MEVELKLAVPASALHRTERLPWLRKLATLPPSRNNFTSVYFDTRKLKLRKCGATLRVRKARATCIQTIKGLDGAPAALGRFERQDVISSNKPRLKFAKDTPLAPLVTKRLERKLAPVFRTDVQRDVLNVHLNESDIEIAFDRGRLAARHRSEPICELELELKQGRASDLAALARRLQKEMPVAFEPRAKAERGYALMRNTTDAPVHALPIALQPGQSAGAAFAQIGLACLHHFAANDRAVLARQPEGVHQMRVGLRRLRAAISLFGAMLKGREVEDIKQALKWVTAELAPARDLDVLTKEAIAPLRETAADKPEIALLEHGVKTERSRGFARARDAVSSLQFREIVLRVALWLINGEWSRAQSGAAADLRERPISPLAARILNRRAKKIIKKAKRLDKLDALHRHKLRIAVKKLRYGCAFFESLFGHPKRRRRYAKIFKELQVSLGKLNDIRVHDEKARRLAHRKGREPVQAEKAYAMGLLTGREQRLADGLVSAAQKAGRRLSRTPTFW